jgi:putative transposase
MSGRGACWDNAVVERFFGSLKNEWLLNIYHLTRNGMKDDVEAHLRSGFIHQMVTALQLSLNSPQ